MGVPKVVGRSHPRPFLRAVTCQVPKAPCTLESLAPSRLAAPGGTRTVGEGAGATLASLALGKRLFQIVLWLRSKLAHAGSRISGVVGWVSSFWVGTQSSQAHAWECDQPVFRSWLCCESWGKSSDLSERRSPVQHGGPEHPLRGPVRRRGKMQVKLLAVSGTWKDGAGCYSHGDKSGGPQRGRTGRGPRAKSPASQGALLPAGRGNTEHLLYAPQQLLGALAPPLPSLR